MVRLSKRRVGAACTVWPKMGAIRNDCGQPESNFTAGLKAFGPSYCSNRMKITRINEIAQHPRRMTPVHSFPDVQVRILDLRLHSRPVTFPTAGR